MDGMYLQTGRLYAPVCGVDGQVRAFQEVKPVTAREREAAFLAGQSNAVAVYRPKSSGHTIPAGYVPLIRLQKSGLSPLDGNYDLTHIVQLPPETDFNEVMKAFRDLDLARPGDIATLKKSGVVTCWYVGLLTRSQLPGLMENALKTAEMSVVLNYNQTDGVINSEAPKPSVRDSLKQLQREADRSHGGDSPGKSHRDPER